MNLTNDLNGKTSSKRVAGLACIAVGLLIALASVIMSGLGLSVDAELVDINLGHIFPAGFILLGLGVAEYFSKFKKIEKQEESDSREVGYAKNGNSRKNS